MKRFFYMPACLFLLSVLFFGCSEKQNNKKIDAGLVEMGVYFNSFFDFTINIPDGWEVRELTKTIDKKYQDLSLIFLKSGTDTISHNLVFVAENISANDNLQTAADYLLFLQQELYDDKSLEPAYLSQVFTHETIGNEQFFEMDVKTAVHQRFYCALRKKHALSFTLSYINDEQKAELENIFRTIKFGM